MASFKGLYDKLMSIIKIDTVVDSGVYIPSPTDIIPVYDYQNAVDSITGEKIATKKFVRATDLGGGGGASTETILYSKLSTTNVTNVGLVNSFTIPAGTIPANSMLYIEARLHSTTPPFSANAAWGIEFKIDDTHLIGKTGTTSKNSVSTLRFININNVSGSNNVTSGAVNSSIINDYTVTDNLVYFSRYSIDWSLEHTLDLNILGTLPAGGVTLQMFRIKLATETPMP